MSGTRSALFVFTILLVSYAYFHNATMPSVNALSRFALVRALVEDGTTRIDRFQTAVGDDKAYRDGHYYSDKAPGLSILAAPIYWIYVGTLRRNVSGVETRRVTNQESQKAMYICTFAVVMIPSALATSRFFQVATQLRGETTALFATAALGLGSLAFPYSTLFFGHQLSGALLFAAFSLLWRERGRVATQRAGMRASFVVFAGLLAGYAVVTEYPAAVPAVLMGLYLLRADPTRRAIASYALGMLPPLVLLMTYNWLSFGSPLRFGYSFVALTELAQGMNQGFFGLTYPKVSVLTAILFGSYRGLLPLSPVLVLSVVGFKRMWETSDLRPEVVTLASIIAAYLLMNASYTFWDGGWSLGPRHVVPMLPFLALPIAFALDRSPGLNGRTIFGIVLLVISAAHMLASTAVYPLVPNEYAHTLLGYVYPRLLDPEAAMSWSRVNWGSSLGLRGQATLLPLLGIWFFAVTIFLRSSAARSSRSVLVLRQAPEGMGMHDAD